MNRLIPIAALLTGLLAHSFLLADDATATEQKIRAAMAGTIRTPEDVARDTERLPVETLMFFGLRDDMKIVELVPGGGWYTKLLVPVVAEKGEYYAALGTTNIKTNLVGKPGFENVHIIAEDAKVTRPEGAGQNQLEIESLGVSDVDMVLTFRNYHNFDAAGRAALNKAVYNALKPGGIYAIKDHNRRHMEPDNPENRRRVDPVMAIKEIQDAGFTLVDYSTLHHHPDDELRYEVGRKSVTGNTDRWTMKFIKK